jgi:hypothetical protein
MKLNGIITGCMTFTLLFLTACGGGSSGSSNDNGGQITPQKLTIDLISQASLCDIQKPLSGADVILHRQDGSILSQSKSPSNGKVDIVWPATAKHLTIATEVDGKLDVNTDTDVVAGDMGVRIYRTTSLNMLCDCEMFYFDTTELKATYSGYKVIIDRAPNESAQFCKQSGKYETMNIVLEPQQSGLNAYAATMDLNTLDASQTIVIPSSLFENTVNEGVSLSYDTSSSEPASTTYSTFSETEFGRVNWIRWSSELQVFPGLYDNNFIAASAYESLSGNEYGDVYYSTGTRKRVADVNAVQVLNLPQDQNGFLAATSVILDSMVNDGPSYYDFSNIGSGNTMLYVSLTDAVVGGWSIDAPLSGTMPELILPASIEQKFEQMMQPNLSIQIYGYNTHNPSQYHAFRKQRAETTRSTEKTRSNFFDNYTYQYLNVDINY